jgi:hypothetical protein
LYNNRKEKKGAIILWVNRMELRNDLEKWKKKWNKENNNDHLDILYGDKICFTFHSNIRDISFIVDIFLEKRIVEIGVNTRSFQAEYFNKEFQNMDNITTEDVKKFFIKNDVQKSEDEKIKLLIEQIKNFLSNEKLDYLIKAEFPVNHSSFHISSHYYEATGGKSKKILSLLKNLNVTHYADNRFYLEEKLNIFNDGKILILTDIEKESLSIYYEKKFVENKLENYKLSNCKNLKDVQLFVKWLKEEKEKLEQMKNEINNHFMEKSKLELGNIIKNDQLKYRLYAPNLTITTDKKEEITDAGIYAIEAKQNFITFSKEMGEKLKKFDTPVKKWERESEIGFELMPFGKKYDVIIAYKVYYEKKRMKQEFNERFVEIESLEKKVEFKAAVVSMKNFVSESYEEIIEKVYQEIFSYVSKVRLNSLFK